MKLYIKQKLTLRTKFDITDSEGCERYHVVGELFSMTRKLHIYDSNGTEVALIRRALMEFMPKFIIEKNGRKSACIKKKFTLMKPVYEVEGKGWRVQGDTWAHNYVIVNNGGGVIASIHKVWMSWGDSFELDLNSPQDEVDLLAVILAIDMVMDDQAAASSGS